MSHDSHGQCFFARQPANPEETTEAIEGTWASCCGALRYGGTDSEILVRMAELGLAEQCDFRLKDEPKCRARNCVSFEFEGGTKTAACGKEITTYVADSIEKSGGGDGKVKSLLVSSSGGSFVYEWGHVLSEPCCAMFTVEFQSKKRRWAIQISREDGHQTTAFAIRIHKALVEDIRFRSIQWFTDDERKNGTNVGHLLPL
jgi:hypothetical protein